MTGPHLVPFLSDPRAEHLALPVPKQFTHVCALPFADHSDLPAVGQP